MPDNCENLNRLTRILLILALATIRNFHTGKILKISSDTIRAIVCLKNRNIFQARVSQALYATNRRNCELTLITTFSHLIVEKIIHFHSSMDIHNMASSEIFLVLHLFVTDCTRLSTATKKYA